MASKTTIANMALSHLAVSSLIADLDTENSKEAKVCRAFYEQVRDMVLSDCEWNFAKRKSFALGLVTENPTSEWLFAYRYPSECLSILRIESGAGRDSQFTKIPYELASDDVGRLIYINSQNPRIDYIHRHTQEDKWPPEFAHSLSFLLANVIAPQLTGGDAHKLGDKAFRNYILSLSKAKKKNLNEEEPQLAPMSELEAARI